MGRKSSTTHSRLFKTTNKKVIEKKLPDETVAEYVDRAVDFYCSVVDNKCGKGKK